MPLLEEPSQLMVPDADSWVRRTLLSMIENRRDAVATTTVPALSIKQRAVMAHRPGDFAPLVVAPLTVTPPSDISTDGTERRREWAKYLMGGG